jgi:hypothetical protein
MRGNAAFPDFVEAQSSTRGDAAFPDFVEAQSSTRGDAVFPDFVEAQSADVQSLAGHIKYFQKSASRSLAGMV